MAAYIPITRTPICAPAIPTPPLALTAILSRFDREQLAGFIAVAIDLLDIVDGDADVELNGDELDGTGGEDDFVDHDLPFTGPGCPISDPGGNGTCGGTDDDEPDIPEARQPHRDRLRRTTCVAVPTQWGTVSYRPLTGRAC